MLSLALALSTQADAAIVINEIMADPGVGLNDSNCDGVGDSVQDEFVEIVNSGPGQVDLSGVTLSDGLSVKYTFAAGTVLAANRALVVYGGGAAMCTEPNVQYFVSARLDLNNGGDTVTLTSAGGQVIDAYTYGAEGGFDQSLTRSPDLNMVDPLVQHSTVSNSMMSPGTMIDGTAFGGGGNPVTTLGAANPGTAGGINTWTLTGGAANTMYVLVGSLTQGQFAHPQCPNDPVSMSNPQVIGQATTNAQGAAQFSVAVPAALAGRTAYIQAGSAGNCDVSTLSIETF